MWVSPILPKKGPNFGKLPNRLCPRRKGNRMQEVTHGALGMRHTFLIAYPFVGVGSNIGIRFCILSERSSILGSISGPLYRNYHILPIPYHSPILVPVRHYLAPSTLNFTKLKLLFSPLFPAECGQLLCMVVGVNQELRLSSYIRRRTEPIFTSVIWAGLNDLTRPCMWFQHG